MLKEAEYLQHIRDAHAALSRAVLIVQEEQTDEQSVAEELGYRSARLEIALDIIEMEIPEVQQAEELAVVEALAGHWRGEVKSV
jgi:hypothetical protein